MLELIGNIFSGGAIGGLFGVIGTGLQMWGEYKQRQEANRHEETMRKVDLEELSMEISHAETIANITAQKEVEVSADENFRASQRASTPLDIEVEAQTPAQGWIALLLLVPVEALRRFTRPGLTWGSAGITLYFFHEFTASGVSLTPDQMADLLSTIVVAVVTVFTTAATWWFGQRYMRPKFSQGEHKG